MVDLVRGKYRIVREIARSNDIVYEAMDTSLGRRVAIKELNIGAGMTGQARRERIERFNREARAAGGLNHANIVSVFDYGEENGRHYIAMEYLEGQNLREIEQVRSPLPLSESLDIACQILDALAYAHSKHVIHRDIKPDNIQVLPGGRVKLTDFGIARLTEEPALTGDGQVFGTPSYMSPEQIEGRAIDSRSDIFSLAVVLYEMLTGRKPFTGDSVVSITYAIMNADPSPMYGVPASVEEVIRHALSKQPGNRQSSADLLIRELRRAEQTPHAFPPAYGPSVGQLPAFGQSPYVPPVPGPYAPPVPGPYVPPIPGPAYGSSMPTIFAPGLPPAPQAQPQQNAMPWAFSKGPQDPGGTPLQPVPAQPGMPQAVPPGAWAPGGPVQASPFPARRSEPLFVVSPKARNLWLSFLAAVAIGCLLAFGVVSFENSYYRYRETAGSQQTAALIEQGNSAYNGRDYSVALRAYEQARDNHPTPDQVVAIEHNLVQTYIQLARVARADGHAGAARDLLTKALKIAPTDSVAQKDMANLAQGEASTDASGTDASTGVDDSDALRVRSPAPDAATGTGNSVGAGSAAVPTPDFVGDRRAQARDLINQGLQLQQSGDPDGAREKWLKALTEAPGTPERDQANRLLNGGAAQ